MSSKANFIGGKWRPARDAVPNINPSDTSDIIAAFARGTADDVGDAIEAARRAQDSWATISPEARGDILRGAALEMEARAEELGDLLAREEGKTRPEAIGEVGRAARIFHYFSGEALRMGGEIFSSVRAGVDVEVRREPLGVVGIITPWNFPIAIPAWKIAPALAHGNSVIFKPAETAPASAWALVDILDRAGAPDGVINLVMGSGREVGQAIASSCEIDAISFTGSETVGRQVREMAAANGIRVQTEMGGKNPFVVLADADLDTAVDCAVQGAFYSTGQRCTASSRIIVERSVFDAFFERIERAMSELVVGDARAPDTQIGPVVSAGQRQSIVEALTRARDEGAAIIGGETLQRGSDGHYLAPALVTGVENRSWINQEEVFGPVASLIPAEDFDHAIDLANDTRFGLSAGIATSSLEKATAFKKRAQAGMVMVNLPTAGVDYHVPFGGTKASSFGPREQGSYAREFFTSMKTAYIRA